MFQKLHAAPLALRWRAWQHVKETIQHRTVLFWTRFSVRSVTLNLGLFCVCVCQLFIMLGNDRANDFWAARLSVSEELDCDSSPEQRREFIGQKYREGRFRLPHPGFSSQDELLKVWTSSRPLHTAKAVITPRLKWLKLSRDSSFTTCLLFFWMFFWTCEKRWITF